MNSLTQELPPPFPAVLPRVRKIKIVILRR